MNFASIELLPIAKGRVLAQFIGNGVLPEWFLKKGYKRIEANSFSLPMNAEWEDIFDHVQKINVFLWEHNKCCFDQFFKTFSIKNNPKVSYSELSLKHVPK
jgi:hypothetical protein